MKKTKAKLKLSPTTIRTLTEGDLSRVAGGYSLGDECNTNAVGCNTGWCPGQTFISLCRVC